MTPRGGRQALARDVAQAGFQSGLYVMTELCERYGASIDYRARPAGDPHGNEFFVVMRRMPLADTEARLHLSP